MLQICELKHNTATPREDNVWYSIEHADIYDSKT